MRQFDFNVFLTDRDYDDYSKFVHFKSNSAKRLILIVRIAILAVFAGVAVFFLIKHNFNELGAAYAALFLISGLFIQFLFKPFVSLNSKLPKLARNQMFIPQTHMTFYIDRFVCETMSGKNEYRYPTIDRVSVVGSKAVYLHHDKAAAEIIPFSSVPERELGDFIDFITKKCDRTEYYAS